MSYVGNTNTTQAFTPAVDFFSGNGSTTAFTLSRPVASVAQVQVTIDNVAQNPSSAYTVSNNTITFTSAPLSGTNNIYVYYTSPITQVIAPGQGTVNATSLASSTGSGAVVLATSPTITTPVISSLSSASATALTLQSAGTTAVTVDTSQNVLIGATSNSSSTSTPKVFIAAGSSTSTTIQAMPCGAIMNNSVNTGSSGYGVSLKFLMSGGEPGKYAAIAGIGDSNYANSTALTFYTNPNGVNGADNNVERMRINSSGNVILGSNTSTTTNNVLNLWSPTSTLNGIYMQKNGQVEVQMGFKASTNTDFYIGTGSTTMGTFGVYLANTGNSWISVSDVRQKDIIEPIENGLTKVSAIRAVIGKYKHDADGVRRSFLIAQDVQAVFPEAVKVQEDEEALLGLSYTDVIPLLVASIKELKTIVDAQAAEIAELKAKVA